MKKTVSVIIPVYNADVFLRECLDSVIFQSEVELDIICVDDASSDESYSILLEYENNYSQVKAVHLDINKGQANARNIGLHEAVGNYVCFLDADDCLAEETALFDLIQVIEKSGCQGVFYDSMIEYENDELLIKWNKLDRIHFSMPEGRYNGNEIFSHIVNTNERYYAVWRQLWKKDFLDNNSIMFDENTSPVEDMLFTFDACSKKPNIYYYPKLLHKYRVRGDSSIRTINKRLLFSITSVYYSVLERCAFKDRIHGLIDYESAFLFLELIRKEIKEYLDVLSDELEECNTDDELRIRHLIDLIFVGSYPLMGRKLSKKEIEDAINCENIIIYGAGAVASELICQLAEHRLYEYYLAVTDINNNNDSINGKRVYAIRDLAHLAKSSVVFIAASGCQKNDMKRTIDELAFDKVYMCCGDD